MKEYLKKHHNVSFEDDRKSLTVKMRIDISKKICSRYSILKQQKDIFHEQIFSAMEDYLRECEATGYKYMGL